MWQRGRQLALPASPLPTSPCSEGAAGAEVTRSGWRGAPAITVTAAGDTPVLPPCITLSGSVGHPRLAPGSRATELRQIRVAVHPMETRDFFHRAFGTARSWLRLQPWRWGSGAAACPGCEPSTASPSATGATGETLRPGRAGLAAHRAHRAAGWAGQWGQDAQLGWAWDTPTMLSYSHTQGSPHPPSLPSWDSPKHPT